MLLLRMVESVCWRIIARRPGAWIGDACRSTKSITRVVETSVETLLLLLLTLHLIARKELTGNWARPTKALHAGGGGSSIGEIVSHEMVVISINWVSGVSSLHVVLLHGVLHAIIGHISVIISSWKATLAAGLNIARTHHAWLLKAIEIAHHTLLLLLGRWWLLL